MGLLFPDHLLKLPVLTQTEYASAIARAYNRWLVDTWTSQKDGLLGCIVACTHDPEDAAREIAKYADHPEWSPFIFPARAWTRFGGTRSTTRSPKQHSITNCRSCCTAPPSRTRCSRSTIMASTPNLRDTRPRT